MELRTFLLEEIKNLAFKPVTENEALITSKLLDSITVVELIVSIEEKTGKKIPQHLIVEENFDSIEAILRTLEKC